MSKQMAEKQQTEMAEYGAFEEFANAGMEEVGGIEDLAVPYISILQALSPQVKKADGAYIEGAAEGMIYNNVTKDVMDGDEGITVIPCFYTKSKVEWNLREEGGGLVAVHPWNADIPTTKDDRGRNITENNTQIVDTRTFFVVQITKDGVAPAVINFTSTQAKKARQWNSLINSIQLEGTNGKYTPPMFSSIYKLTTVPESNKKGSWFGWSIERIGFVDPKSAEFQAAKKLYQDAKAGMVQAQMEEEPAPSGNAADTFDDDDIAF